MEEALGGLLRPRIESRPACQALKSLATHKTDRNDARGLAHLARIGGSSVHVVCGATLVFTVASAYAWEHSCSGAGVYDNHPCLRWSTLGACHQGNVTMRAITPAARA